jgi:hypothetical protein
MTPWVSRTPSGRWSSRFNPNYYYSVKFLLDSAQGQDKEGYGQ